MQGCSWHFCVTSSAIELRLRTLGGCSSFRNLIYLSNIYLLDPKTRRKCLPGSVAPPLLAPTTTPNLTLTTGTPVPLIHTPVTQNPVPRARTPTINNPVLLVPISAVRIRENPPRAEASSLVPIRPPHPTTSGVLAMVIFPA